jgi:hypothetical protein
MDSVIDSPKVGAVLILSETRLIDIQEPCIVKMAGEVVGIYVALVYSARRISMTSSTDVDQSLRCGGERHKISPVMTENRITVIYPICLP